MNRDNCLSALDQVVGAALEPNSNRASSASLAGSEALTWNEVHVWWATIEQLLPDFDRFWGCLSPDERARWDRFRFAADRERYLAARGMLRRLLAKYSGIDSKMIEFEYGHNAKPGAQLNSEFEFSVSHSGALIVQAFTRARRVGIDVEKIREDFPWSSMETLCFSSRERSALSGLPKRLSDRIRFAIWTRKEAYLKATGEGIGHLTELDFPLDPPGALWGSSIPSVDPAWRLHDLRILGGYHASLAVEGPDLSIRIQRLAADDLRPKQV
jgi:4'-phosphopantetheinyl transferase